MSASQAVFAGWMEIEERAVQEQLRQQTPAKTQQTQMRCSTQAQAQTLDEMLAALVAEYSGTLYRVAFSVLHNAADAEDAVQEAFLRVLRHSDAIHEIRDRRVWLIRIVWNVVLDRKRRQKTRPETDDVSELARVLPADGLSAEERAAAAQYHAYVLSCVEQLPIKEREVLMLSAFEELNSVEIASVLGITESSVRSRLYRARNLVAELLNHTRNQQEHSRTQSDRSSL